MLEILQFALGDLWHFFGTMILMGWAAVCLAAIAGAVKPIVTIARISRD